MSIMSGAIGAALTVTLLVPLGSAQTLGPKVAPNPFVYFGQGDVYARKWLTVYVWFETDVVPAEMEALARTLPCPSRSSLDGTQIVPASGPSTGTSCE